MAKQVVAEKLELKISELRIMTREKEVPRSTANRTRMIESRYES